MNATWSERWRGWNERFALTPQEKRLILFVFVALLLGFAAQAYRTRHPHAMRGTDPKHPWRKVATATESSKPKRQRAATIATAKE